MGLEGCLGVCQVGKAGRAYQAAAKVHVKAEEGNLRRAWRRETHRGGVQSLECQARSWRVSGGGWGATEGAGAGKDHTVSHNKDSSRPGAAFSVLKSVSFMELGLPPPTWQTFRVQTCSPAPLPLQLPPVLAEHCWRLHLGLVSLA